MKTAIRSILMTAVLGALVMFASLSKTPDAEASPSVSAALVDNAGNIVPGHIPPRVILDLTDSIPAGANTNWKLIKAFNGTEFAQRVTWASGYVDAGYTSTAGLVLTVDFRSGCGRGAVETEDILVKVTSPLTFSGGDAGTNTTQLDVGITGTLERFAKDVDLEAAAGTRVLGSSTTSVKPRLIDAAPLVYRFTITQSLRNLTTVNGGQFKVFALCGNVNEF